MKFSLVFLLLVGCGTNDGRENPLGCEGLNEADCAANTACASVSATSFDLLTQTRGSEPTFAGCFSKEQNQECDSDNYSGDFYNSAFRRQGKCWISGRSCVPESWRVSTGDDLCVSAEKEECAALSESECSSRLGCSVFLAQRFNVEKSCLENEGFATCFREDSETPCNNAFAPVFSSPDGICWFSDGLCKASPDWTVVEESSSQCFAAYSAELCGS